ncbi:MAG: hypothetical protein Q7K54_04530 [Candidatus Parcubacteria bacterium]|nr:hypothetical protein [Candidatus Parcubacteria bacterium]
MRKIKVNTIESKLLTVGQIKRMYAIMCRYYDNMDPEMFKQDLYGKDVTFLLIDDSGEIQGFTSIIIYEKEIDNKKIAGVFSGDTIIEKEFRGSFDLPFAWLNYVYDKKEKYDKTFWFMLSKGYRTYRLLPRFFKEHYPCYYKETPKEVSNILDKFAHDKFGDKYNPETNIYIPSYNYFLKSGKEEIGPQLLKNPHIRFFQKRNPGFWQGHELVNYADFDKKNLTLYGLIFINFGDSGLVRFFAALSKKFSKLLK